MGNLRLTEMESENVFLDRFGWRLAGQTLIKTELRLPKSNSESQLFSV